MPGGRRGRGGGGGGGGGNHRPREEILSKKLSWLLRHGAPEAGVAMDERGFVNCQELPLRSLHVTFPELRAAVASNSKRRFELAPVPAATPDAADDDAHAAATGDDAQRFLIRATQGHSLPIKSEALLAPLLPTDPSTPELAVHGTTRAAWRAIQASGGLRPMTRTHVHFAPGLGGPGGDRPADAPAASDASPSGGDDPDPADAADAPAEEDRKGASDGGAPRPTADAAPVVSGLRASATVLVWVALRRSAAAGALAWWRSANGVLLTEGDAASRVGLEWVVCAEERRPGGQRVRIWDEPAAAGVDAGAEKG